MPGSYEDDKSSSSNLINSLRSYRLKGRPKYQLPSQSSLDRPSSSEKLTSDQEKPKERSIIAKSSTTTVRQNENPQQSNSNPPSNSISTVQNYSPLSYRKYEISHTSQFILPCILTKAQQAIKKNSLAILDLQLQLTEEEYIKLKELVLKEASLAEQWKCKVIETTSYVTCGTRELKVNRQYLSLLCKYLRKYISNGATVLIKDNSDHKVSQISSQLNTPNPVKTYSRTPKVSNPKVISSDTVTQSVSNTMAEDSASSQPQTKDIMDEYEVFCEKEQNLRKLLDAFPGADIMEAQDILVKCNWNLQEATKIALSLPLRCSRKKTLQQTSANLLTEDASSNSMNNQNLKSSGNTAGLQSNEEIVLDSSDEDVAGTVKLLNKRSNGTGKMPVAKRIRRVISDSDSDDGSFHSIQSSGSTSQSNSVSNFSSNVNSISEEASSVSESVTIKPVPNATNCSEQSKQSSQSFSNVPNLPKGLVITQLGSSSTTLVTDTDNSNKESSRSTNMVNQKAEIITVPSVNKSDISTNKPAQLVRIKSASNGVSSSSEKSNLGYSVHMQGSVVSLPNISKGISIKPVFSSNQVSTSIQNTADSSSTQGKSHGRPKLGKGKRKKYALSDDEDEDYGNDNIYDSDDSDVEETLTSAHTAVLKFFQEATVEELGSISGCSKKKVEAILNLRPFASWVDLVQKLGNDKFLSTDLLNGAKKVLDMRNAINKLMAKCQQISLDMEDLVESLKENKESSSGYVANQPSLLNETMHLAPYQMLGLNWMLLLHNQEVNGILADEMGLGKTVQAISFLAYLKQINIEGPHLIIVPSSTLDNWKQELHLWWPSVSVLVYHGSQESRRDLRFQILNDEVEEFDVMVTTYNMVTSSAEDRSFFKRLEFEYVIFDEAHMLKNMSSQRYQHLMRIRAPRRLLLTGTPLQNNLVELMSLLVFAMPDMFSGKVEQIKQMFSAVTKSDGNKSSYEKERIDHAKRIMKPFVLRRLKKEVLQDLPAKHDETRYCKMTDDQAEKYKLLVEKFSAEVEGKDESSEKISSSGSGMMMQLRRAANHPLLLRRFYDNDKLVKMANEIIKEPTHTESDPNLVHEDMCVMSDFELHRLCKNFKSLNSFVLPDECILSSGKFRVLDELLPGFFEKGHRVLLFSQFTMVLDIIEEYMNIKDYKFMRLDGQTPVSERQEMIDEFNNDSSVLIFLLSTRAGGLGINLTAADTVILHDIDFNPYNDKQAEDRCHRVGQKKDVKVIRLISENSIEDGILQCAKEKLKLERDIHDEDEAEENDSASVAKLLRDALCIKTSKS